MMWVSVTCRRRHRSPWRMLYQQKCCQRTGRNNEIRKAVVLPRFYWQEIGLQGNSVSGMHLPLRKRKMTQRRASGWEIWTKDVLAQQGLVRVPFVSSISSLGLGMPIAVILYLAHYCTLGTDNLFLVSYFQRWRGISPHNRSYPETHRCLV